VPAQFSGSKLRALRRKRGLSTHDLAFACRRTSQTVWFWETGKQKPLTAVLEQLTAALDCDIADLFEDVPAEVEA
jgi:transcriptional regulator with XRE-family HTH domain